MTTKPSARPASSDLPSTEQERLATLLQITDALSSTLNTKSGLQEVLETLARRHAIAQSLIVRIDEDGRQLHVEAAHGLNRPAHHIHYTLGEGVIGKVVETGKAVIVPRTSREPSLVLRASGRDESHAEEATFICVPIGFDRRVVGALGVNLKFKADRNYERSKAFYGVVASAIGQALKVQRLVAAQHKRLVNENAHLKQELRERYDFAGIVGNSGPMQRVYEQVAQVARTNTTVLLRGESGTGKELIASAIHYNSSRAKKPFVKVSCGALPDTLIESELFGYEKGAFTGADARKKGRFELAEGGTLFLDEIGDVQLATQVKLLRVLQEREFERLGGHETLKSDVRLIAATNKDLERAIEKASFREDLFYRLNVFPIFIPPLRERKPDVLLLADHFLQRYSAEHGRDIRRLATPAIDMLTSYHWPGNARELQNVIERAVLVCDGHVIHAHHLSPTLQTAEASGTVMSIALDDAVAAYEKDLLQDALKSARGNRAKAARLLRTTERIVNYKVRKLGIDWKRFKP
ncbi:MAG: sigma 54-interacting transcriptional regulator [Acidobacteriota bacterium]|nr:sigma 54-interacting transcriptional regulator [Acidobacteriota bacterium]